MSQRARVCVCVSPALCSAMSLFQSYHSYFNAFYIDMLNFKLIKLSASSLETKNNKTHTFRQEHVCVFENKNTYLVFACIGSVRLHGLPECTILFFVFECGCNEIMISQKLRRTKCNTFAAAQRHLRSITH